MSLRNFQEKVGGWLEGQTDRQTFKQIRQKTETESEQSWADSGDLG